MKTYNIPIAILFLLNVANSFVVGPNKVNNWDEAQAYCVSIGSNLASITSLCEQMLAEIVCFKSKPENIDHQGCWFGLNDRNSEGQFNFIDGTPFDSQSYTNWNKIKDSPYGDEPNNLGNEDCVEISFEYSGKWNDYWCNSPSSRDKYPLCNDPLCNTVRIPSPCFDTTNNNPCTQANINARQFYHPSCTSQYNFIQCDEHGGVWDMVCPTGTVWNQNKVACDYQPAAKTIVALNDLSGNNFNDMNDINIKNNNNYYGYIILIGIIAFIVINNIFIGCWCLGKVQHKAY
eukprot:321365_1